MMGFAYYSRQEDTQKLAVLVLASHILFTVVVHTDYEMLGFYFIDSVGVLYSGWLWYHALWRRSIPFIIMMISGITIGLHFFWGNGGLIHIIAYNLLYMAQLVALCTYAKIYGRQARQKRTLRNDPFYRFLAYARH